VPFVGCPSDGQAGPVPAPNGIDKKVQIEAGTAKRLAYYTASGDFGILAPRGWDCFEDYGSSGGELFVVPGRVYGGIVGPVVELDATSGSGSGTSQVSRVVARVFPAHWSLVKGLIAAGDLEATDYPFGPYPKDKLIVQTDHLVQYRTPAHSEGLGTMDRLRANGDLIDGIAILDPKTLDLLMLKVRLPRELRDLAPVIIQQLLVRQRRDAR